MIKRKCIVLFLLSVIPLFMISHQLFGQLTPFQKKPFPKSKQKEVQQQQVQLMPGLHIPQPTAAAPQFKPSGPMRTKPTAKLSRHKVTQYFGQAAQAMNLPSITADFTGAFTISLSNPAVPGKGRINEIHGAGIIHMCDLPDYGCSYVKFFPAGDDGHYVQIFLYAKQGLYLVKCEVTGGPDPGDWWGVDYDYFAHIKIQGAHQDLGVSGLSDHGFFVFPVYVPQDDYVYITFASPTTGWCWKNCEITPQS
jgi:hypothetical protein